MFPTFNEYTESNMLSYQKQRKKLRLLLDYFTHIKVIGN